MDKLPLWVGSSYPQKVEMVKEQILIVSWSGKNEYKPFWLLLGSHIKVKKCLPVILSNAGFQEFENLLV